MALFELARGCVAAVQGSAAEARRRAPVNRTAEAVRSLGEIELVALLYVERLRP